MTTFVLVHGAFHGAWCWEPLIEELDASGHHGVAIDVPIDRPEAGWHDHLQTILAGTPDARDVVLVGHSRAGRMLPLALERRNYAAAIFIAASLPAPLGAPPRRCDRLPMMRVAAATVRDELGREVCPPERASTVYYHDCTEEARNWALARLRPQCDVTYPRPAGWPSVPSTYIAGQHDRAVNVEWMRAASLEVFDKPAVELASGHTPFLSHPAELADRMIAFVNTVSFTRLRSS